MSEDVVLVLAKRPEAGRVKTRLAATLGTARTLRLAEAFALDTLRAAARVPAAACHVAYAPADAAGWFRHHAPRATLVRQPEGDLGARLAAAFAQAFARGARRVVAIGTDTPQLTPEALRGALEALHGADVCLGPARDGGYYLIGLRAPRPALFDGVAWSTPHVLRATRARAEALGLSVAWLREEVDVDDAEALAALPARLAGDLEAAPVTRQALRSLTR